MIYFLIIVGVEFETRTADHGLRTTPYIFDVLYTWWSVIRDPQSEFQTQPIVGHDLRSPILAKNGSVTGIMKEDEEANAPDRRRAKPEGTLCESVIGDFDFTCLFPGKFYFVKKTVSINLRNGLKITGYGLSGPRKYRPTQVTFLQSILWLVRESVIFEPFDLRYLWIYNKQITTHTLKGESEEARVIRIAATKRLEYWIASGYNSDHSSDVDNTEDRVNDDGYNDDDSDADDGNK